MPLDFTPLLELKKKMSPFLSVLLLSLLTASQGRLTMRRDTHVSDALSKSIAHIIRQFFAQQASEVSVVTTYESKSEKRIQLDALSSVLPFLDESVAISLYGFGKSSHSMLILANSLTSFRRAISLNHQKSYDFMGSVLVFITKPISHTELRQIFRDCLELFIINVYVILRTNAGLELITYFPFTKNMCFNHTPRTICFYLNYRLQSREFKSCVVSPNILTNFHGCELKATLFHLPPYVILETNKQGKTILTGVEGEVVNTLAKRLNFTMAYVRPDMSTSRNRPQLFLSGPGNFSIGRLRTSAFHRNFSTTIAHLRSDLVLVTRSGRPLYSMERLLIPASTPVWLAFLSLLVLTYVSTLCICWNFPRASVFIFGRNVRYPTLWIGVATIGGPIHNEPQTNFARFVFIQWVILVFFLRSGYLSFMYLSIQMNWKTQIPSSLEELLDEGYTLISTHETRISVLEISQLAKRVTTFQISEGEILELLEKSTVDRIAAITPREIFENDLLSKRPDAWMSLKDPLLENLISIHLRKNSYLKIPFDNALVLMASSGLLTHWQKTFSPRPSDQQRAMHRPETIKFEDVSGCFQLYAIGIVQSFVGLAIEFGSLYVRVLRRFLNLQI